MPKEGVIREGVATKAKAKPKPDLELIVKPVIYKGYKA
jgi:hypothetical protein